MGVFGLAPCGLELHFLEWHPLPEHRNARCIWQNQHFQVYNLFLRSIF